MKKNKLSLEPQQLDMGWYYEDNGGIEVYIDFVAQQNRTGPAKIKIPWRKLRASLKRKDSALTPQSNSL